MSWLYKKINSIISIYIPFRQLGEYENKELDGLYYNRFRYYNPESGIFISSDPISILGGLNTYAYV
ncbi:MULTISPECIES: RHS repeat-associated core domain-containing protein, partial [unclassified Gilliamella]|uniref:RHS repeat-associated core domain-containing protein n=1 Tax=unclassified Gilliamella TaxID=2685620 RepID=UPI0013058C44